MKSRIQWLSLEDKNTDFFHATTINKRRRNKITQLQKPNFTWITKQKEGEDELLVNLKNTLCKPYSHTLK